MNHNEEHLESDVYLEPVFEVTGDASALIEKEPVIICVSHCK
jgi:hypothetical protein